MREIKFRAWDGEIMHNVSELHFCMGPKLDGNGLKFYGPGVGQGWIDGESIHLMQYTGLKDKNGKEIYEGDILNVVDKGIIQEDELGLHIVEYEDFYFKPFSNIEKGSRQQSTWFEMKFTFEVVGNIYENPELVTI